MNKHKTNDTSADHWTDAEYQELVQQIANRLVNGATPGQVAGDLQQEHGWSPKAAMEVVRDAQKRMANEGSQILEELDAEQERKSGERGLIGEAVRILGVVAVVVALLSERGWGYWGVGIGVAAGVAMVLVRLVMRRRRRVPSEEAFPRHEMRLERKAPSTGGQPSSPTAPEGPVSRLRKNKLPKKI